MKEEILEHPPVKLTSQPSQIKEEILNYLFEYGLDRPLPMNEYLKKFSPPNLETFIFLFGEFEKNEWARCNGNYGWLGSRHSEDLLDLSHPLVQFSCQLLPAGVEYLQKKNSKPMAHSEVKTVHHHTVRTVEKGDEERIPWYQHWLFWLISIVVLMTMMIALVESKT